MEKNVQQATLCFVVDPNNGKPSVLLGLKKRGFGVNKWNGFGGKIGENESVEEAAVREIFEETTLHVLPDDLKKAGEISFATEEKNGTDEWNVHVFITHHWHGSPAETDEMKPEWFTTENIPYNQMWADDQHWLPFVLEGKKINARFVFENDNETIREFELHHQASQEKKHPSIYFAASISGGRNFQAQYEKMADFLAQHARVLTQHVASANVVEWEKKFSAEHIFRRDTAWLKESDALIAEVSTPSLGVGYEIGLAESLGKKIYCLYNQKSPFRLSSMVKGNANVQTIEYENEEDALEKLEKIVHEIQQAKK